MRRNGLFVFCFTVLFSVISCQKDTPVRVNSGGLTVKILSDVPFRTQTTNYSCGAAALQSVLAFYGIDFSEEKLMKELGTDPQQGTEPEPMAEFAIKQKLTATIKQNLTVQDLANHVNGGHPVIVAAQAYRTSEKPWSELWDDGHYMVVVGVDDKNLYFVDPSSNGQRGMISIAEFNERWHDTSRKNEKLIHLGILFAGQPKALPPFVAVP